MRTVRTWFKSGRNVIIIVPVVLFILLALGLGASVGYRTFRENQARQIAEKERLNEEQRQVEESIREEQRQIEESIREEERQIEESIREEEIALRREAELEAMRSFLDSDTFFQGLYLDDVNLRHMTLAEAIDYFTEKELAYREAFQVKVVYEDQALVIDHQSAALTTNWLDLLEKIWLQGRENRHDPDESIIVEQYERAIGFKDDPLFYYSEYFYDEEQIEQHILAFAAEWSYNPVGAAATGFDTSEKKFIVTERRPGLRLDGQKAAKKVLRLLGENEFGQTVTVSDETVYSGHDAATIIARTGFIAEAETYAEAVNPGRDENMRLVADILNGMVLQPGETFSFNGFVGRRTAERGFREAGGIVGGVLVEELGGGICQPTTTLFQAVAKAGLEIVARSPHSWPSTYTSVGLDATVNWGGPDFKFRNNTDFPVAIMSWYTKPAVVFQIYGQLLDEGVTIELVVDHLGYIPIPDPEIKETFNPELLPGERVELRKPYIGQRTTAYRVWEKDGSAIKREVIAESYYRPLQGLVEYGPDLPPEPLLPEIEDPEVELPDIDDGEQLAEQAEATAESAELNE